MYKLNQLQRNVLITPDEVIFHAPTGHSYDPRKVETSIIVAEERFIRPALTYELYEQIITEKNRLVTSSNLTAIRTAASDNEIEIGDVVNSLEFLTTNTKRLWKEHLWKLVAECVLFSAMPDSYVQSASAGVVLTAPPAGPMSDAKVFSPDLKTFKHAMDKKLMDRIDPLTEAMHLFICKNRVLYPNYDRPCDCDSKGVAYKRKTNFVLGIYDDEPKRCCNGWDQLRGY